MDGRCVTLEEDLVDVGNYYDLLPRRLEERRHPSVDNYLASRYVVLTEKKFVLHEKKQLCNVISHIMHNI